MSQQVPLEVGNTPLIKVDGVYVKLECVNPTGSIKDRMVKFILDEGERRGLLKKGVVIVEATSGNTGIALAYFGRKKGYEVKIIMPDNMTEERKELIRGFGAELILSPAKQGFLQALWIRDNMVREGNCFTTDQFSNDLNVKCHYETTGQEIIRKLGADSVSPNAFVAGVGTGGTLIGIARALREINPNIFVAAVEPEESAVMSGGEPGPHEIGGIGDGFIPALVRDEAGTLSPMIEEVIQVKSDEAISESKRLAKDFGFCVGVSAGANFLAAKRLKKRFENVVTVFPDGYTRYESLGLGPSGRCGFHGSACRRHNEIVASLRKSA
ncbi:MAG TPA: cysteine synthase family protein [Nitrososphaerales archaeon]|nr:cysteine synthase family protein [Nitrososphaerales archaeon]